LLTAFAVRFVYAVLIDAGPYESPIFDGSWYHRVARDIVAGEGVRGISGKPTAFFPPGYPALLGVAYALFGAHHLVARVLNCVLATATCLFTYGIGRRAYGEGIGLLAAAIFAVLPGDIFYASQILSEVSFGFALSGCIYAFLVFDEDGVPANRWLLFGLLLGLSALVRGIALPYLAVPILVWIVTRGWSRATATRTALAALGLLLAVTPWTIRNQLVMGSPILIASDGPHAFIIAHSPVADGSQSKRIWKYRSREYGDVGRMGNPMAEAELAKADLRHGLEFMLTHPGRELALVPKRLYHLFRDDHFALRFSTVRYRGEESGAWHRRRRTRQEIEKAARLADLCFFGVLTLAVLGLTRVFTPAARRGLVVPLTPLFFVFAHGVVFWGDPRFHAPFVPMLAILAAVALDGRARPWPIQAPAAPSVRTDGPAHGDP
jgi:hypothetical protein